MTKNGGSIRKLITDTHAIKTVQTVFFVLGLNKVSYEISHFMLLFDRVLFIFVYNN